MRNDKMEQIAEFMEGRSQITANELAAELSCSRQAALKNLKALEEQGLLKSAMRDSAGQSRATRLFLRTEKPFPVAAATATPSKPRQQPKVVHKFRTDHLNSLWGAASAGTAAY